MTISAPVGRSVPLIEAARRESGAFRRTLDAHLNEFIERFAKGSIDYGDDADDLGLRGQFVDLNRKVKKLRRAMWDDGELVGEDVTTVLFDLAAHCFIAIDLFNRDEVEGRDA